MSSYAGAYLGGALGDRPPESRGTKKCWCPFRKERRREKRGKETNLRMEGDKEEKEGGQGKKRIESNNRK